MKSNEQLAQAMGQLKHELAHYKQKSQSAINQLQTTVGVLRGDLQVAHSKIVALERQMRQMQNK